MSKLATTMILVAACMVACGGEEEGAEMYGQALGPGSTVKECKTSVWQDPAAVPKSITVYAIDPVVQSEQCGCPVSGWLKFVDHNLPRDQHGGTQALVLYGDGACDGWALKVLCHKGRCEKKHGGTMCKFRPPSCAGVAPTPAQGS